MKVIHVPYCYYPDPVGGTEVYVTRLSKILEKSGIESVIAAPTDKESISYLHDGLKVSRFGISNEDRDLSEFYGGSDPVAAREFCRFLDKEKPDILHMHAITYAASLAIILEAKARKIPVIFTYHTPTVTCQSGLLLKNGITICSGLLNTRICAKCALRVLRAPPLIVNLLMYTPKAIDSFIKTHHLKGRIFTAMRLRHLLELRISLLKSLLEEVTHFIAPCAWARDLLLCNKVPPWKITLVRHGISLPNREGSADECANIPQEASPLKVIYLGRAEKTKGIETVIKALMSLPKLACEFDIYTVVQSREASAYLERLKKLAERDERIKFFPPVTDISTVSLLKKYHYIAIPSVWMETGPLVALEAMAAGTPVIGSDIGSLPEIVRNGIDGILIPIRSLQGWRIRLQELCRDRTLLRKFHNNIKTPRTMDDVAGEVLGIYREVLKERQI